MFRVWGKVATQWCSSIKSQTNYHLWDLYSEKCIKVPVRKSQDQREVDKKPVDYSSILADLQWISPLATFWQPFVSVLPAEDQVVVSSDYDSTHEANHSDSSDVAHTEEDTDKVKSPSQSVNLRTLIPPEVSRGRATLTHVFNKQYYRPLMY